jgi:hypothetical protein
VRQNDPALGELARLRIDLNRPGMLFDDDQLNCLNSDAAESE